MKKQVIVYVVGEMAGDIYIYIYMYMCVYTLIFDEFSYCITKFGRFTFCDLTFTFLVYL